MGFWERKREKIFAAAVILHGNQGRVAGGRCEAEPVQEEGEKERERERENREGGSRPMEFWGGRRVRLSYIHVCIKYFCVCMFVLACLPAYSPVTCLGLRYSSDDDSGGGGGGGGARSSVSSGQHRNCRPSR